MERQSDSVELASPLEQELFHLHRPRRRACRRNPRGLCVHEGGQTGESGFISMHLKQQKKVTTYILVATEGFGHVARGILIKLLVVTKNDDRDVDRTKNRQFVRLFEQATLSLQKCAG